MNGIKERVIKYWCGSSEEDKKIQILTDNVFEDFWDFVIEEIKLDTDRLEEYAKMYICELSDEDIMDMMEDEKS